MRMTTSIMLFDQSSRTNLSLKLLLTISGHIVSLISLQAMLTKVLTVIKMIKKLNFFFNLKNSNSFTEFIFTKSGFVDGQSYVGVNLSPSSCCDLGQIT